MARKSNGSGPHPVPYDELAEMSVIGAFMMDPDTVDEVSKILRMEDFHDDRCRSLFEASLRLRYRGEEITQITLAKEVSDGVQISYLSHIMANTLSSVHARTHAETILDLSLRRQVISALTDIFPKIYDPGSTLAPLLDRISLLVSSVQARHEIPSRVVTFTNPIISLTEPPLYTIHASGMGREADIQFKTEHLDNKREFKRRIRESLHFVPDLPPGFDLFISNLIANAKQTATPPDTKKEDQILTAVKEWFAAAKEAESPDDLVRGYVEKRGYRWFQSSKLHRYLTDQYKMIMTRGELWEGLKKHGAERSESIRVGTESFRLWGLPIPLFSTDEDISWLED